MDISKEKQVAIIEHEMEVARESRYILTVRARVAKDIKNDKGLEACQTQLEQVEKTLAVLEGLKKELADKGGAV